MTLEDVRFWFREPDVQFGTYLVVLFSWIGFCILAGTHHLPHICFDK